MPEGRNAPTAKGEVLVGEITDLRLRGGKVLLPGAHLQDKYPRRIVNSKVSELMTAQLAIEVFLQARRGGLIGGNAIIDTNQGSQDASGSISPPALDRRLSAVNGAARQLLR
ncbi:MAG: hypothetical protein LH614_16160 [Pyrinomonadaceae bacterium]|nr:hypothetical protein [Pyrinomonadaceae bacterium]